MRWVSVNASDGDKREVVCQTQSDLANPDGQLEHRRIVEQIEKHRQRLALANYVADFE